MTIRRGESWGEAVPVPADAVLLRRDADVSGIVRAARSTETAVPTIGLVGGDLARTLGGGRSERFDTFDGETVVRATVDLLRVEVDGRSTIAAAHVVLRRRWWRGPLVFVMNAQYLGALDIAPRSHPNDGRADVIEMAADTDLRTRLQARHRARTGTHLPHPQLTTRSVTSLELSFDHPLDVWVDGERWATARSCRISVEPDAVVIHA